MLDSLHNRMASLVFSMMEREHEMCRMGLQMKWRAILGWNGNNRKKKLTSEFKLTLALHEIMTSFIWKKLNQTSTFAASKMLLLASHSVVPMITLQSSKILQTHECIAPTSPTYFIVSLALVYTHTNAAPSIFSFFNESTSRQHTESYILTLIYREPSFVWNIVWLKLQFHSCLCSVGTLVSCT